ncbi:hypothetical protein MIZ03_4360 [Rhodoferax lithotrophicus]|uniref:Uncharacterized protein n=1 Tax=Rhodoferax lithotrophicus TaxID=2798804 RepID=A0ABM7MM42_9BURK|nr:hypothetical protein MIZ03_2166 [Rhodoferax sp. MIZ03]BCO29437.1 hypothetical protein MIZ03_4360 [Rhodoferax sp. MIZ03]
MPQSQHGCSDWPLLMTLIPIKAGDMQVNLHSPEDKGNDPQPTRFIC